MKRIAYASWHEPSKQEPAKRLARSAGFAIRSPRGMGDPARQRAPGFIASELRSNMRPRTEAARSPQGHKSEWWVKSPERANECKYLREASLRSSRPPSHGAWESTAGSNSFRGLWPTDRTH